MLNQRIPQIFTLILDFFLTALKNAAQQTSLAIGKM